ncbi:MAG: TIGR04283 family arsenosugar biosynthesis glycosyltransferase [Myxococcota bacterium]
MPGLPHVSVVLPVLDEASRIDAQLTSLAGIPDLNEVIVVDGGSTDGTLDRVRQHRCPTRVLTAPRGRARQMNAGARLAHGEIVVFLHADVRLPADAVGHIRHTLRQPGVVAGAFRTWTVIDDPEAPRQWMRHLLHVVDVRSRYTSAPYGDQALFVWRDVFDAVGGFPEVDLMEDLALSRRLRQRGRIGRASARVQVSGRRFLARPVFYTVVMNAFPLLYDLGVPTAFLRRFYENIR